METTLLRDLVAQRIGQRWNEWAKAHPHLAEAIDQTRLIEAAVERLREDPQFTGAMARAQADEDKLGAAVRLVGLVEAWVSRLMPV